MKRISCLILAVALSGCASSYHNINKNGESSFGGGFRDKEEAEGVYFIIAKSNFSPWTNFDAAHTTFNRRAHELCEGEYTTLDIKEDQFEHIQTQGAAQYIISRVEGYVHCQRSPLSVSQAREEAGLEDH